jgi:AcrR family transcriptional regulator
MAALVDSVYVDTRAHLVQVGVETLEAGGLEALSLRTIARRAGVSHGAPRRYFPTYAALLGAIARAGVDDLDRMLTPALAAADDLAGLREAAAVCVDFARDRPEMFALIGRHDLLEGAGGHLREVTAPWFLALGAALGRCLGRPPTDAETIAAWAGVQGLAQLVSRRAADLMPMTDPREALSALFAGLVGQPRPDRR